MVRLPVSNSCWALVSESAPSVSNLAGALLNAEPRPSVGADKSVDLGTNVIRRVVSSVDESVGALLCGRPLDRAERGAPEERPYRTRTLPIRHIPLPALLSLGYNPTFCK